MTKILFINPNLSISKKFIDYPYFINLNMLQAASVLKNKYDVTIYDSFSQPDSTTFNISDEIFFGSKTDIDKVVDLKDFNIFIILNSPFLKLFSSKENKEFKKLIKKIKTTNSSSKIILADCYIGGMHYVDYDSAAILKRYPLVDAICKLECESELITMIEGDKINNSNKFYNKMDDLPFPDYEGISLDNYTSFLDKISKEGLSDFFKIDKKTMPIFMSRGCIHDCIFCTSRISGRTYREYSLAYIKKHLLYLKNNYNINKLIILDELINPTEERLDNILKLLEELDLNYEFPNGLRADKISDFALSMLKNKISLLSLSAESGSQDIVNNVIGKNLDLNKVKELAISCDEKNIPLAVHFMIGLPGEGCEDINKTIDFAIELFNDYKAIPLMQLATPIPGSKFFKNLDLSQKDIQDIFDNYIEYFFKGKNFSKIDNKKLNLFLENLKIATKIKNIGKVIMNTTYACNNNCIFCAVGKWRNRISDIESQKLKLKTAHSKGIRMVDFDGGEPTLSKNLIYLIKYAKGIGFNNITLITNGRLLSIRKNAEKIVKSGVTSILFSLHGPNKNIHEQVTRAESSFEQAIGGIKNILEMNINRHLVNIEINTTITNKNISYLDDFFEMIEQLKIKKINIQFITPFGIATKNDLPTNQQISDIIPKIIDKYHKRINIKIVNLPYCYLKGYEKYLVQDVLKKERNMIFIGKEEKNLATFLSSKKYKDAECKLCPYNVICSGKWDFDK